MEIGPLAVGSISKIDGRQLQMFQKLTIRSVLKNELLIYGIGIAVKHHDPNYDFANLRMQVIVESRWLLLKEISYVGDECSISVVFWLGLTGQKHAMVTRAVNINRSWHKPDVGVRMLRS